MTSRVTTAVLAALFATATPMLAHAQAAATTTAAQASASNAVNQSATRVLSALEARRAEFKANPAALNAFIKAEFTRSFDSNYAARLVLGTYGRGASDADVADFAAAMTDSLIARYGASLLDFNSKLQVKVKSETPLPGGRGVRVGTMMLRQGNQPIPVDYLLRQVGGQWKVFDVMIEGISYVQSFKNQFAAPLSQKSIRAVAADVRTGRLKANGNQPK
ncbi:ABC transporter substrate-binding protein [Thermomonas sp. HDW16]|uniref:MlaC/ttg2D family ABC transporter substrate-binding protein n=1 Tax=Thermomonas sp. HDW16 TaxID=2714945 RepID=UPI00140D9C7B|nr:ABC transporter substrate-binding protein [Thermomonas sp. HDW16]QIL19433.1 ABC transporter substrate-binding protein [Thermomonas sp. HDW16]